MFRVFKTIKKGFHFNLILITTYDHLVIIGFHGN